MRKEILKADDLVKWLKAISAATVLTISLADGINEMYVQASSAKALIELSKNEPAYFGNGPFVVEYEESEQESNDLNYTSYAIAFTFQARLAKHPERNVGGLESLKKGLSDFEYIARVNLESTGYLGHLLVVIPPNPSEIEELKEILENLSIGFVFPDGTGTINTNNFKMGRGILA